MKKLLPLLLLLIAYPVYGQTTATGKIVVATSTTKPATCSGGDILTTTDNFALYECGPANTWTAVTSGGGSTWATLLGGTNTSSTFICGTGCSLTPTGAGVITSTNGLNSVTNDTNVTGNITAGVLTLGWQGNLSVFRGGIGVGSITGITRGNGSNPFTAAVNTDVTALFTGTCNSSTFLRGDGSCQSVSVSNPVFQANAAPLSNQSTINFQSSTTNTVGLSLNVSNPSLGNVKYEITGGNYTGNALTATNLVGPGSVTGNYTHNNTETFLGQINEKSLFGTTLFIDCNNTQGWGGSDLGAWINSAIAALPVIGSFHAGNIILGACGTTVTQSTAVTVTSPYLSIIGPGSGALQISCTVTTDCWNVRTSTFGVNISGKFGGFTLIGQGSGNANAVGIHTGDMVGVEFSDIEIDNFLGTNSSCFWMDNQSGWFERNKIDRLQVGIHQATQNGCTKGIRATVNGGTSSFARTRFTNSYISVGASPQIGISVENGVFWYQGTLEISGNMTASGGTVLSMTGNANLFDDRMDIGVECTNACSSATLINAAGTSTMSLAFGRITGGTGFTNSITTTMPLHMNYGTFNGTPADRLDIQSIGVFNNEGATFGDWIIPALGAPSFLGGFTDNLGFTGTNFTTATDLTNNGAEMVAGGHNGILSFLTIPTNSPATGQTISQASLTGFTRATLTASAFTINPPVVLPETTAPSCIVNSDLIYGDSTFHGFKGCTNGSPIHKIALSEFGTCGMSTGTTCTFSIGATFNSNPLTFTSIDATSAPPATAISSHCSVSGTTVTITAGTSNSLNWDCLLIGNPN